MDVGQDALVLVYVFISKQGLEPSKAGTIVNPRVKANPLLKSSG